ncbi:hypothetical protein MCY_00034 [Bartonella rattimassiliensis 15908]|uniref:Uncharacterized protein n=1 Tax=Bartonella rattimassiliensis 15908 TaxID=1094556 RepID=J0QQ01_9HYPH|nr:hypothetical protein MCY_00034 [Bartonella rattimassiliensis 15908]
MRINSVRFDPNFFCATHHNQEETEKSNKTTR